MAFFKCKMCGGTIEYETGATVGTCDSCGTVQTLPRADDDVIAKLHNRANTLRFKCEFDKAEEVYNKILEKNPDDAEAHWGVILCKYGIEYVEDPKTYKRIPTCHRTSFDAILADDDYKAAIANGDGEQRRLYESEAKEIDRIAHINDRNENARLTELYNGAVNAMRSANSEATYKAAADSFRAISSFKDADALAEQCLEKAENARKDAIYTSAKGKMAAGRIAEYESAIKAFETISGWRDADEQIYSCQKEIEKLKAKAEADRLERERQAQIRKAKAEKAKKRAKKITMIVTPIIACIIVFVILLNTVIIPTSKYNKAVALYDAGKYNEAFTAFSALDDYKDSATYASDALFQKQKSGLASVSVGSTIKFGAYEQDNNTSNGKEEIEWYVLAKEGTKILVISKYALDCKPYNTSRTNVTWESCSLHTWLNGTFYNNAFETKQQEMIKKSTVSADKNPHYTTNAGNATSDNVFLLSITEVNKYFSSYDARNCVPTAYAIAQGASQSTGYTAGGKEEATYWWWLRSPGKDQTHAAGVVSGVSVYNLGFYVDVAGVVVRPAMWIDLSVE